VVSYEMGKREEVQPGTRIFVAAAKKQPDGTLQAPRITYGRNGEGRRSELTPPSDDARSHYRATLPLSVPTDHDVLTSGYASTRDIDQTRTKFKPWCFEWATELPPLLYRHGAGESVQYGFRQRLGLVAGKRFQRRNAEVQVEGERSQMALMDTARRHYAAATGNESAQDSGARLWPLARSEA
jgi:hypothetical protein